MLYSYNWIKEFVDTNLSAAEVSERLTMAGIEVDGVGGLSSEISGVVTARIQEIGKHPNADRLRLCKVTTGEGGEGEYEIVCGATNMKEGDVVALALHGATLPGGIKLKRSKIRGVKSDGMMCSEVELGIAEDSAGIMILPEGTELGLELKDALGGGDVFFDVSILPNRPDCISIKGLAREIAAVVGAPFKDKSVEITEGSASSREIDVTIEDGELCRRYTARVVEGVKVGESPDWLKERLTAHGLRPINNVVDATNYILLELGQPLHAFDLGKITGDKITVRRAKEGEKIATIDEIERSLTDEMLVIADGEGPQAVAGVMGGKATEVDGGTVNLLLESAHFLPSSVRRTSRTLGLSSDSSYRFERGVDIDGVGFAMDQLAALIVELAGGEVKGAIIDEYPKPVTMKAVSLDVARASKFLDMELSVAEVTTILKGLGIEVVGGGDNGTLLCTPPPYRSDIRAEEDLIEEVARIKGYDKVPALMPIIKVAPNKPSKTFLFKRKIRELLSGDGFLEVINYSFVSVDNAALGSIKEEDTVKLINPLSDEQSVMRPSLLPSLLDNLKLNASHRNEDMRLFEVSPVFSDSQASCSESKKKELPEESTHLAAVIYGRRSGTGWNKDNAGVDFYDIKGSVERLLASLGVEGDISFKATADSILLHPGRSCELSINGKGKGARVAILGMVHPEIADKYALTESTAVMELDMEVLLKYTGNVKDSRRLPKYPSSERDVAFIIDGKIPYSDILRTIRGINAKLVEKIEVFDVYYGENIGEDKRSLALRVVYRAEDRTLKQVEVEEAHAEVVGVLTEKFDVEIRK